MNVNIGGKEIKRTKSVKSLEVIVDENLSWKEHIGNVCTKLSKAIGIIGGLMGGCQILLNSTVKIGVT